MDAMDTTTRPAAKELSWPELQALLFDSKSDERCMVRSELDRSLTCAPWSIDFWRASQLRQTIPLCASIGLRSSGTTGTAKVAWRSMLQVELEANCIVQAFALEQVDEVVSFAPVNHAFGFLCGIALARNKRARLTYCPQLQGGEILRVPSSGRRIILSLPSTWQMLMRTGVLDDPSTTILHSAGPVPRVARDMPNFGRPSSYALREIFGSTETGAIAYRQSARDDASFWQLCSDTTLLGPDLEGRLRVLSPRCATASPSGELGPNLDGITIEDDVEIHPGRQIRLNGRRDDLVKVNGVNVRLGLLATELEMVFPDRPMTIVIEPDVVRGHTFYLITLARSVSPAMRAEHERTIGRTVTRLFGAHVYPARYVYADTLPSTNTGKVRIRRLVSENSVEAQ